MGCLAGCVTPIRLQSLPVGAVITRLDAKSGDAIDHCATPCSWRFDLGVKHHAPLEISAPGYRTLHVDVLRSEGRVLRFIGGEIFQRGGRELTFVLVPERPPLGAESP